MQTSRHSETKFKKLESVAHLQSSRLLRQGLRLRVQDIDKPLPPYVQQVPNVRAPNGRGFMNWDVSLGSKKGSTVGALIIRVGFWGPLYYT